MAKKLREDFPELSSEILIVKDDEVRDISLEADPSASATASTTKTEVKKDKKDKK